MSSGGGGSSDDAFDSSVPFDETAFHKTLASDIDDAVSLGLLNEVYETNEMWHEFQDDEIQQVVEVFSVLKMAPGEKLITKGEYATFCGIVLQGTFSAIVTPTFTVALRAGDLVGEMSLFEGGARNADIVTGTDEEGCILAVITFVDLDNLSLNERYAALARKLTMLFATASIKKLRGMLKPPPPPAAIAPPAGAAPATAPATAPGATPAEAVATPAAVPTGATSAAAPADAPASGDAAATTAAAAPTTPTTDAAAAATASVSAAATAAAAAAARTSSPTPAAAAAAPAAPAGGKKARVKKEDRAVVVAETLYKNKMSAAAMKDSAAGASATGASSAAAGAAAAATKLDADGKVPRATNINEAQQALEEQAFKLKKVEHARRNQQVMLDKAAKQARVLEDTIRTHEAEISRLGSELHRAQEHVKELTSKHSQATKNLEEMTQAHSKEHATRVDMEQRLTLSAADLGAKMEAEVKRLETALAAALGEKESLAASLAETSANLASTQAAREEEGSRLGAANASLASEGDRLGKDLAASRSRAEALESEWRSSLKQIDEHRTALSSLSSKIADLEEKLSAALSWKLKALELQSGLDAEKKRHVRLSDEWGRKERELEMELKNYKLLLRHFSIAIYAKEWRVRRALGNLHKRVSEMLLTTLEEHYSTATGREKGALIPGVAASGGRGASGGGGGALSTIISPSSGPSSSGSGAGGASSAANFKSVRKRKKAYLDQLLRSGPGGGGAKLREIVSSLDEEVQKLRGPFEEIRERCMHWRATSESFFQRNIDLASKIMALDRGGIGAGGGAGSNSSGGGGAGGQGQGDRNDGGEGALVPSSGAVPSAVAGGRDNFSATAPVSSNAGGGGGGGGGDRSRDTPARGGKGKEDFHSGGTGTGRHAANASSKAEFDLLEARATVLRVHIQQLEQHYLNLQMAIHQGGGVGGAGASPGQQQQEAKEQHPSSIAGGAPVVVIGERFDPSLVSPVPGLGPATTGAAGAAPSSVAQLAMQQQQQAFALQQMAYQQHMQQQQHMAMMQHQHQQQQRPGTTHGGAQSARGAYGGGGAPPATAPYGYPYGAPSARGFGGYAPSPLSPRPDVISLRALRDSQAAQAAAAAQMGAQRLPAVPGAQPSQQTQQQQQQQGYGAYSAAPQQPQQHSMLLATPQRTTLSFTPRAP